MANNIERDIYTKADGVKIPIDYVQNTNAIPIIFHFRDFQIPAGATAQVFVQKPSGLAVYNSATISGNDVTVDVTTQMMAEVGFNKLQLQVMSGEDNLVTFVQPVNVRQNYTDGESEESKNESSLFDELQEAAQAANKAAEAANSAAEEIEAKAEAGDFSSTVTVGSTTTGEPGSQASVTNSGTAQNPVLDFVIPTGAQGPQGPKGDPGSAEDIDTTPVTFEQASTRENVASGDTVATLFGKISKWFSDLGTAAFKGVSNVLTQTSDGYVLDARQGNVLSTMIGVLDNLATTAKTDIVSAINEVANKETGTSFDDIYPVGSVYTTFDVGFNPNTNFSGTWSLLTAGKMLLSADPEGTGYTKSGMTGGAETVTLTTSQIPAHKHTVTIDSGGAHTHRVGWDSDGGGGSSRLTVHQDGYSGAEGNSPTNSTGAHKHTAKCANAGSGSAHNNMPPYITAFMWRRDS